VIIQLSPAGPSIALDDALEVRVVEPRDPPPLADPTASAREALLSPAGRTFPEMQEGESVLLVVSDHTRPTSRHMVEALAEKAEALGARARDITILFATGLHREMTGEEREQAVGERPFRRYRWTWHDSGRDGRFVTLGTLPSGRPMEVNAKIRECRHVIVTGTIEPHYLAGYSGGSKSIMPGLGRDKAIRESHEKVFLPGVATGRTSGNPIFAEFLAYGRAAGVAFLMNQVCTTGGQPAAFFAGDLEEAHAKGIAFLSPLVECPVTKRADVVITHAGDHPPANDFIQAKKAIAPAVEHMRDGGTIVLVADCKEGLGAARGLPEWLKSRSTSDLGERARSDPAVGRHAWLIARVVSEKRGRLIIAGNPGGDFSGTPVEAVPGIQDAVDAATRSPLRDGGSPANVVVLRNARRIVPV
jgi:nickel-dependent lactate racemase